MVVDVPMDGFHLVKKRLRKHVMSYFRYFH